MSLRASLNYLRSSAAYQQRPARTLFRVGAWRLWTAAGIPQTVRLQPWGVRLWLPPQWRGVSKLVYSFREGYEPEVALLSQLLRTGGTFVDAGASFGLYSLIASRVLGPSGKVLAFEPTAASRAVLARNVRLNEAVNVTIFDVALAAEEGIAFIEHDLDPGRSALLPPGSTSGGTEQVRTAALDGIIPAGTRSDVRLIKLDIEGAEELALRGAAAVLDEVAPNIIFEVNPEAAGRLSLRPDGPWSLLASRGYGFYRADPSGRLSRLHDPPPGGNVVAIHRGRQREALAP